MNIKKYKAKHPMLRQLIKYFWVFRSDNQIFINHKLIPVNNIDIILNFSSSIKYTFKNDMKITAARYHFNGIRGEYFIINQVGKVDVLGISFFPGGLYPLLENPLSEFKNKTIEIDLIIKGFNSAVEEIGIVAPVTQRIALLEDILVQLINPEFILQDKTMNMLYSFYKNPNGYNINQFCDRHGINQRKLERYFNKYIGITPVFFQRLSRYQKTMNLMLRETGLDLTTLAFENDYYDQNHFIKEFKAFTGCTPRRFLAERKTIKEIINST